MIFYYLDVYITSYWLEGKWVNIVLSPGDVHEEKVKSEKVPYNFSASEKVPYNFSAIFLDYIESCTFSC